MRGLLARIAGGRRLALRLRRAALGLRRGCMLLDGRTGGRSLLAGGALRLLCAGGAFGALRLGGALRLRALLRRALGLLLVRAMARRLTARIGLRGCALRMAAVRRRVGILSILGHSSLSDGRMLGRRAGLGPLPPDRYHNKQTPPEWGRDAMKTLIFHEAETRCATSSSSRR